MGHWDWVKWLPHALHPDEADAAGPVRLMAENMSELEPAARRRAQGAGQVPARLARGRPAVPRAHRRRRARAPRLAARHGRHPGRHGDRPVRGHGAAVEAQAMLRLEIQPDGFHMIKLDHAGKERTRLGRPDRLDYLQAEGLARQLAPLRASATAAARRGRAVAQHGRCPTCSASATPRGVDPPLTWRPRAGRNRLRVPIGVGADGRPVELDLKESAQERHGPARAGHRRHRLRQERAAAHAGARRWRSPTPRRC